MLVEVVAFQALGVVRRDEETALFAINPMAQLKGAPQVFDDIEATAMEEAVTVPDGAVANKGSTFVADRRNVRRHRLCRHLGVPPAICGTGHDRLGAISKSFVNLCEEVNKMRSIPQGRASLRPDRPAANHLLQGKSLLARN